MDPSSSKDNYDADYKDTAELNTDFTKNRSTEVYHYEAPNLTSMLYEYTNKEQEYINRCFRTGNYTTLREMPDNFVGCTLFKNDGSSRFSKGQPLFGSGMGQKNLDLKQRSVLDKDSKSDPNDKFSNMTDDYDAFLKSLKEEKRDAKEKQMKLHKEDFNQYKAHPKYKGKYEDPFRTDTDSKEKYHFPFLNESDPYEAAKDEVYRNKWLEDSKNLYGEFKPSYKETSLNIPGRTLFMEILEEVKKVLLADWNDVNFVIEGKNN